MTAKSTPKCNEAPDVGAGLVPAQQGDAPTLEQVAGLFGLDPANVFAVKDYGAYVVCVTIDGQKLQAKKHAPE